MKDLCPVGTLIKVYSLDRSEVKIGKYICQFSIEDKLYITVKFNDGTTIDWLADLCEIQTI